MMDKYTPFARQRGFTLIEILIVIVIISIVSGVALITVTNNQRKQFENLANMLVNVITLAEQEAILRPATLGLALSENSYQFYDYHTTTDPDSNPWQPLEDRNLGLHSIPNNVHLSLKIQDKPAPINGKPQIIISESGDVTPFVIFVGKKDEAPIYQVIGDASGKIKSEMVHEG